MPGNQVQVNEKFILYSLLQAECEQDAHEGKQGVDQKAEKNDRTEQNKCACMPFFKVDIP